MPSAVTLLSGRVRDDLTRTKQTTPYESTYKYNYMNPTTKCKHFMAITL